MARARPPLFQLHATLLVWRGHNPNQAQPQPLPGELRHGRPLHPLHQSPLAPSLPNRLPPRLRRLVLPLLLPRRPPHHLQLDHRRPHSLRRSCRRHHSGSGFHQRVAECARLPSRWDRSCAATRRV